MAVSDYYPNYQELPQMDRFWNLWNFVKFYVHSWSVIFFYDRVTNVRQIRLGLYEYGKIQLQYTKCIGKYGTNMECIYKLYANKG